jgi:hypothetical protein
MSIGYANGERAPSRNSPLPGKLNYQRLAHPSVPFNRSWPKPVLITPTVNGSIRFGNSSSQNVDDLSKRRSLALPTRDSIASALGPKRDSISNAIASVASRQLQHKRGSSDSRALGQLTSSASTPVCLSLMLRATSPKTPHATLQTEMRRPHTLVNLNHSDWYSLIFDPIPEVIRRNLCFNPNHDERV